MSVPTLPLRVVVAGGGVAALEAVLALRALAQDQLTIDVVAPESTFVYRPLSVADPFQIAETRTFPLAPLVEGAGATLTHGLAVAVDPLGHMLETDDGKLHSYDALLVALGARPHETVDGALTFVGPQSHPELAVLLDEAVNGTVGRIVFALPSGTTWPLPLYELALLTNAFLAEHATTGVEVEIVTPEDRPLGLFGTQASEAIAELLELREIRWHGHTTPMRFERGTLQVAPGEGVEADRVVALARLEGPRLHGLPYDGDGFIPIDEHCGVVGHRDIFAAGDATRFPLKQGGIATQQADVAAAAIAARISAAVEPQPFRPVLRGLLLTGMAPRFMRTEPGTTRSVIDTEALWWPPAKIVGRYLAPFLAARLGLSDAPPPRAGVPVEVELDPSGRMGAAV